MRLQIVVWVLVTIVQTLPLWHRLKFFQLEGKASCCGYGLSLWQVPLR